MGRKAFTKHSHRAMNACEGLKYQAFTPESHWKSAEKRQKRHSGGEHFEIKAFTLESFENQA
ncbi:MAG: hypothetical protein SPE09_01235 [Alloprevotella sp.]|nr:hypothetical protein [Alloprevotella sp.]